MQFRKILPWVAVPVAALALGLAVEAVRSNYFDGRSSGYERPVGNQGSTSATKSDSYSQSAAQQASAATPRKTFDFGKYLDGLQPMKSEYDLNAQTIVLESGGRKVVFDNAWQRVQIDGVKYPFDIYGFKKDVLGFNTPDTVLSHVKILDVDFNGITLNYLVEESDFPLDLVTKKFSETKSSMSVYAHSIYVPTGTETITGRFALGDFKYSYYIGNLDNDPVKEVVISTSVPTIGVHAKYRHSESSDTLVNGGKDANAGYVGIYEMGSGNGIGDESAITSAVNNQIMAISSAKTEKDVQRVINTYGSDVSAITAMVFAGNQMQNAIDTEALQHVEELGAGARAQIFKAAFQALMGDPAAVLSIIDANKYKDFANLTINNAGFYSLGNSTQPFNGTTGSAFDPSTPTYRYGNTDLPKNLIPNDIKTGLDRGVLTPEQMTALNGIVSKYNAGSGKGSTSSSNGSTGFDYTVPHGNYDPATDPRAAQNAQDRAKIDKALNDFNSAANNATKGLNETANSVNDFLSGLLDDKKNK